MGWPGIAQLLQQGQEKLGITQLLQQGQEKGKIMGWPGIAQLLQQGQEKGKIMGWPGIAQILQQVQEKGKIMGWPGIAQLLQQVYITTPRYSHLISVFRKALIGLMVRREPTSPGTTSFDFPIRISLIQPKRKRPEIPTTIRHATKAKLLPSHFVQYLDVLHVVAADASW